MRKTIRILVLVCPLALSLPTPFAAEQPTNGEPALRLLLTLQSQQQEILRKLDAARQNSAEELKRSSDLLAERLQRIENSVALEAQRQFEARQNLHQLFLVALAVLGALGAMGLGLMGMLVLKTLNRLSDVVERTVQLPRFLPAPDSAQAEANITASTQRLLESMAQVESRLREIETRHLKQGG